MRFFPGNVPIRMLLTAVFVLCSVECFPPPDEPLVDGPTLAVEIDVASETNVAGSDLVAVTPLDAAAQTAHSDFLTENADILGDGRLLALKGARVRLRRGPGVDELADAFDGLTIFVASEDDPTVRVALASAVVPTSSGSIDATPIANRMDYEVAQPILTAPSFMVGVSGPTPLSRDRLVEFGVQVELELTLVELIGNEGGGHGCSRHM